MTEKTDNEFKFINSLHTRVLGHDQSLDAEVEEKPKLVFLHGLLGNGQNWLPIAREFEKDYTILLLDQRGHGKSHHPQSYHPKDFAQDLKSVLDELGWSKVNIVGHSLGGRVGIYFASKFSNYIDSLVIEDMGPQKTGSASSSMQDMLNFVPIPFKSRSEAKDFFETKFKPKYGAVLSGYLYSNIERKEDDSFNWRFSLKGVLECIKIGQIEDFWQLYKEINAKTLVIRGERSEHLPLNIFQEMLSKNENVEGVQIPDSGHWVHFDQKDLFVEALKKFLLKEKLS